MANVRDWIFIFNWKSWPLVVSEGWPFIRCQFALKVINAIEIWLHKMGGCWSGSSFRERILYKANWLLNKLQKFPSDFIETPFEISLNSPFKSEIYFINQFTCFKITEMATHSYYAISCWIKLKHINILLPSYQSNKMA